MCPVFLQYRLYQNAVVDHCLLIDYSEKTRHKKTLSEAKFGIFPKSLFGSTNSDIPPSKKKYLFYQKH